MTDTFFGKTYKDFVKTALPLYSSSLVTIRIGSTGKEFVLSKALICAQSPYFRAMFDGHYQEGQKQCATLDEEDGVVSTRGFELLVQWMYTGRVIFGDLNATDTITATIEFARIADMCGVGGMETTMAEHIRATILANTAPESYEYDANTYNIEPSHIISASCLPAGHPVRKMLAAASVRGYLREEDHKFSKEAREVVNYASDLLDAAKDVLKMSGMKRRSDYMVDCFSGTYITPVSYFE